MAKEIFNPWEVSGDINYKKLVKEFGITPLKDLPDVFKKDILFRRNIVFAARDIGRIINCIKDKKKFVVMTGLMPTGKFHIGHSLVIMQAIFYQKLGATVYIAVADVEAYNARNQSLEKSREIAKDYLINYFALGLNPKKTIVYFQSGRSSDSKESNAYYRLQNLFANHVTFNEFKGVYGDITPGKMLSSLIQASDMYHPQLPEFEGITPTIIPVGIDQDPHIRLARNIARRFNKRFYDISSSYNLFLPGLKGGKMSASDPNSYISFDDSPSEVKNKINKYAFSGGQKTLEEHRKKGGNPDVDVPFKYLKYLFEESDEKLKQLEEDYRSGKLLTGELKKYTIDKINEFLKKHQERRKAAKSKISKFILKV